MQQAHPGHVIRKGDRLMGELEHWRDIKGYVGLYEISDKGRVASFSRKYAHKETIILVPNISDRGYALVTLCKNGKTKHFQVHRLVAEAFIDNPKNKPQVNHIDGNPLNNCKENLEWATAQENIRHKYDVLKYTSPTRKAVRCVETDTVYESISAAADGNSLSVGSLSSVLKGGYGRKTLGGYHWEYVDEPEVIYPSNDNELVIHFEDTNECQDFYNKLLAWKRLKDNGMIKYSFHREKGGIDLDFYTLTILAPRDKDSLDLLFGGEE